MRIDKTIKDIINIITNIGFIRNDYIDVSGRIQENYQYNNIKIRFDKNCFFVVTENEKKVFSGFVGDQDQGGQLYQYLKLLNRKTIINKVIKK